MQHNQAPVNDTAVVSVIVPCYNQAQYLDECLESVYNQTYKNWECIIVNDGSPDNTEEVARPWTKKDSRFKYVFQHNGGVSRARNRGIHESMGEYILPLDGDDKIGATYIEKAVYFFSTNPGTKLVYCKAEFFGEKKGKWDLPEYSYNKLLFNNIIFCSSLFRRKDFDKTTGYNENMQLGLEDWDFLLGFLEKDDNVFSIPEVLFFYRIKKVSRTTSISKEKYVLLYRQIVKNHKDKYERYLLNEDFFVKLISLENNQISWEGFSIIDEKADENLHEKNTPKQYIRKIIMYFIPWGALALKLWSVLKKKVISSFATPDR